jgi:hypothetical protein
MNEQWQRWATQILKKDSRAYGFTAQRKNEFILTQAVKLGEEVGESHAEILAKVGFVRPGKSERCNDHTLKGNLRT